MFSTLLISNFLPWFIVIFLAIVVLVLTRQIGQLHQRTTHLGSFIVDNRSKVRAPSPVIDTLDIKGEPFRLDGKQPYKKDQLLFFIKPSCPICKSFFPALKSFYYDEKGWLEIVLVSEGSIKKPHLNLIETHGLTEFRYIHSAEIGMAFQVKKLPYSVLISEGVIVATGPSNIREYFGKAREYFESLLEARNRYVTSMQEYLFREYLHGIPGTSPLEQAKTQVQID